MVEDILCSSLYNLTLVSRSNSGPFLNPLGLDHGVLFGNLTGNYISSHALFVLFLLIAPNL